MPCEERERLESALDEMVNRLDYLNKLRRNDPKLRLLKQEIERLSLKIHQAQRKLHTVGLVDSGWVKIATRSPIDPGIRLRERRASTRRRVENVDRLLEDQFDSHLSPLRTGIGSRSFRLRAVRTGDGDHRLVG